jgi:DNA-binding GntR family transcriptional regulator
MASKQDSGPAAKPANQLDAGHVQAPLTGRPEQRVKSLAKSAAKAYDHIRIRILDGRLAPASHLREHILAAEIGVSRTPIREALRRLAADGFVTFVPNVGASVISWSGQSLADLIEVRTQLAGMAARLAASRIKEEQIEQLRQLNAQLAQVAKQRHAGFLGEAARLNIAFHRVIFTASGNEWLARLLEQTAYLPMVQRAHFAFDQKAWQHSAVRYADLIDALASGESDWAAALIQAHFLAAKHAVAQRASDHGADAAIDVDAGAGDIARKRGRQE